MVEQEIAELKSFPVWMNFRIVHLFMWNKKGLSMIASYLGKPLMMDTQTVNKTRMSYARICAEIGVECDFPESFTLTLDSKDIVEIKMVYSWRHPKFSKCAVFGHVLSHCSRKAKKTQKLVQKWVQKKTSNFVDAKGWITISRNSGNDTTLEAKSHENEATPIIIKNETVYSEMGRITILQEVTKEKTSKRNEFIMSNPSFILDKCMEKSHEMISEHDKENFQGILKAA